MKDVRAEFLAFLGGSWVLGRETEKFVRERERERIGRTVQLAAATAQHAKLPQCQTDTDRPGGIDPSRVQAQGCRARAGVLARMRQVPHPYGLTK